MLVSGHIRGRHVFQAVRRRRWRELTPQGFGNLSHQVGKKPLAVLRFGAKSAPEVLGGDLPQRRVQNVRIADHREIYAREKHGGGRQRVTLREDAVWEEAPHEELLDLDRALEKLEARDLA